MSQDDPALESHYQSMLTISSRIRGCIILEWTMAGLIFIVLYAHKPPVSNQDLYTEEYSQAFVIELVSLHADSIALRLEERMDTIDEQWLQSARGFVDKSDVKAKTDYLAEFLARRGERRPKHIKLVYETSDDIGSMFSSYLEESKDVWQVFEVPILSIRVSRDEVSFYLSSLACMIQLLLIAKIEHLKMLNKHFSHFVFYDPSLFSATVGNLVIFSKPIRFIIYLAQWIARAMCPLVITGMLATYMHRVAEWNCEDYTRLAVGLIVSAITCILTAVYYIRNSMIATDRKTLYN
jgi:hypothetical protein